MVSVDQLKTKIDFAHFAWVNEIRLIKLVVWIHTSTNDQFIDKIKISWKFSNNGNFDIQQPGVLHVGLFKFYKSLKCNQ